MSDADSLYRELKADLERVAGPMFEFACEQVKKRGAFLPVGAAMSADGDPKLIAAMPDEDETTSEIVLPLLIEALRETASASDVVGLCEWVKITLEGGKPVDAVKVHAQHKRGLAVAFYISAKKSLFRGWQFGEMFVKPTEPLIPKWPTT